jgi:hypothetical protein
MGAQLIMPEKYSGDHMKFSERQRNPSPQENGLSGVHWQQPVASNKLAPCDSFIASW